VLRDIRARVMARPRPSAPIDRGGVEMAGDVLAAAPEPDADALELENAPKPVTAVSPDSRVPRR
jgi:hypothetical protein